jgi:hypothetical protein
MVQQWGGGGFHYSSIGLSAAYHEQSKENADIADRWDG